MALKTGIDHAKGGQFSGIEESAPGQHAVPDRRNVAVGEKKQILIAPFHIKRQFEIHDLVIKRDHKFSASERSARVPTGGVVGHPDDVAADLGGNAFEFGNFLHRSIVKDRIQDSGFRIQDYNSIDNAVYLSEIKWNEADACL